MSGRADVFPGLSQTMFPCLKAGQAVGPEVAGSHQIQPGDDGGVHPERTMDQEIKELVKSFKTWQGLNQNCLS